MMGWRCANSAFIETWCIGAQLEYQKYFDVLQSAITQHSEVPLLPFFASLEVHKYGIQYFHIVTMTMY